ncbi:MAG: ion channel [Acidimicrobiales bacterium]
MTDASTPDRAEPGDGGTEAAPTADRGPGLTERMAARETDDLREMAEAFDDHDRSAFTAAASQLHHDLLADLFGPTSFVPVFLLTLAVVLVEPLSTGSPVFRLASIALVAFTLLTAVARSRIRPRSRRAIRWLVIVGMIGAAASVVTGEASSHPTLLKAVQVATSGILAVLFIVTIALCLRELLHHEAITLSSLGAAMSAYLVLGLLFATLFGLAATAQDGRLFAQPVEPSASELTYYSFITLTTVGYGDLSPGTGAARTLAVAEAIAGQIFLVTIVARVVSSLGTRREHVSRPDEPTPSEQRAQRWAERRRRRTGDDRRDHDS